MCEWIETGQGNRISKKAIINGSNKIIIAGHCVISAECIVDGNATILDTEKQGNETFSISIGRYCIIENAVTIRPPVIGYKKDRNSEGKIAICRAIQINSFVWIGAECRVDSQLIGSWVVVGRGSALSRCCKIGDVVIIDRDIEIPENYQVPSYSRVSRNTEWPKSIFVQPIPVAMHKVIEDWCIQRYLGAQYFVDEEDLPALFG